jgi:hypothetical protein
MRDYDGVAFTGQAAPTKKHFSALPTAEVRIAQADDGRWMWAVSFHSSNWGFGYAPLAKWGNFARSRADALAAGIDELLAALRDRKRDKAPSAVIAWLESLQIQKEPALPAQLELFA